MNTATLKLWRRRLFLSGGGMIALAFVLMFLVVVMLEYVPIEGHVLALMMGSFGAGYALYAGFALPLFGRALARVREAS